MLVHKKDAAMYGVRLLHLKYIHICMYIDEHHRVPWHMHTYSNIFFLF